MARRNFNIFKKIHQWVDEHKTLSQTYTNIISTLVTLAALVFTIYFSTEALRESQKSNNNAKEQIQISKIQTDLSKSEFDRSKLKEKNDSLQQVLKDKENRLEKHIDSVRLAKNDAFQKASFRQQHEINFEQLKAITKQANTAEAQFNLQTLQTADLYERNKAIFNPDTVTIQKLRETLSLVSFRILNTGNGWAHVDSTYLAVYNPNFLYFNQKISLSNVDLLQFGNYKTAGIDIFSSYVGLPDTYYCLKIYYYDTANKIEKSIPKFFSYTYNARKEFVIMPVQSEIINTFYEQIIKHRSTLNRL